jgi:hypothetical protein
MEQVVTVRDSSVPTLIAAKEYAFTQTHITEVRK